MFKANKVENHTNNNQYNNENLTRQTCQRATVLIL